MKRRVKGRQGLSLVEVIVVLLILMVATTILAETIVRGVTIQQHTAARSRAAFAAQAIMDALLRDPAAHGIALTGKEGAFPAQAQQVDGDTFGLDPSAVEGLKWQAYVTPRGNSSVLHEITVQLAWTTRGRERKFELVSLVAAQPR